MQLSRLFFVCILISLLLTGCATETEETSGEFPPSMNGAVVVKEQTYKLEEGNSRWERKQGLETEVVTTDAPSPPQLAEMVDAIKIEWNTDTLIEIEQEPDLSVYLWNDSDRDQEIELIDNQFMAPSSQGRYVYEVFAEWAQGEVSYTFVVEVE